MDDSVNEPYLLPIMSNTNQTDFSIGINYHKTIRRIKQKETASLSKHESDKKSTQNLNSFKLEGGIIGRNPNLSKNLENLVIESKTKSNKTRVFEQPDFSNLLFEDPKIKRLKKHFEKGRKFNLNL